MGERKLVIKGKRRWVDDNEEDSWGEGLNICLPVLGPFVTPFYTSKFPSHSLNPPRGCGAPRQAELQFPLLRTSNGYEYYRWDSRDFYSGDLPKGTWLKLVLHNFWMLIPHGLSTEAVSHSHVHCVTHLHVLQIWFSINLNCAVVVNTMAFISRKITF